MTEKWKGIITILSKFIHFYLRIDRSILWLIDSADKRAEMSKREPQVIIFEDPSEKYKKKQQKMREALLEVYSLLFGFSSCVLLIINTFIVYRRRKQRNWRS